MAIKRNCSYHISEDRLDRAAYILTTVGMGEIVRERERVDEQGRTSVLCLTDTGVILVFNKDKTKMVTLYIAEQQQVSWVCRGNTPSWLFKVVKKNKIYAEMQNKVRV